MAGSLIKIDEEIVTSAVASVTLTGIDSTYDVYKVVLNNVKPVDDNRTLRVRFTSSGTAITSSDYDEATKMVRTDTTFTNESATNSDVLSVFVATGTGTGEQANAIMYCFNFNNASEYSFVTVENTIFDSSARLRGKQGGAVLTLAQACDGLNFFMTSSSNIDTGSKFTLYGLKK